MQKTIYLAGVLILLSLSALADGLDAWTKVATTPYGSYTHIVYGNGMYAANSVGTYINSQHDYTNGLSVSSDGTNWNHFPGLLVPSGLAFGNGIFVKSTWDQDTSGDAGFIFGSTTAIGLTNFSLSNYVVNGQYGLTYGTAVYASGPVQQSNGLFVAVGLFYEDDVGTIKTSTDGQNWTNQTAQTSDIFFDAVAYGPNFVAVGHRYLTNTTIPTRAFTSSDGTNWTAVLSNLTASVQRMTDLRYVHNSFYAKSELGNGTTNKYYSTSTGVGWASITPPFPSIWVPVSASNGIYVSINSTNGIYTSSNGTNWVLRNPGLTNKLTGIAFDGHSFVACSADGSIFRSESIVPSVSGQNGSGGGFQLTVADGLTGQTYKLQASTDLTTWSNIFTFSNLATLNQFVDTNNYTRRYYRTVAQ